MHDPPVGAGPLRTECQSSLRYLLGCNRIMRGLVRVRLHCAPRGEAPRHEFADRPGGWPSGRDAQQFPV
eukprot:7579099-Lingulodinium_polyedra.AAC.1